MSLRCIKEWLSPQNMIEWLIGFDGIYMYIYIFIFLFLLYNVWKHVRYCVLICHQLGGDATVLVAKVVLPPLVPPAAFASRHIDAHIFSYFWLIITRSGLLAEIKWSEIVYLKIPADIMRLIL